MVFKLPRAHCFHLHLLLIIIIMQRLTRHVSVIRLTNRRRSVDNTEQLDSNELLGVLFQSNFKINIHVQNILSQCTQRMYLIKLLKHQEMPQQQSSVITYSIIIIIIIIIAN